MDMMMSSTPFATRLLKFITVSYCIFFVVAFSIPALFLLMQHSGGDYATGIPSSTVIFNLFKVVCLAFALPFAILCGLLIVNGNVKFLLRIGELERARKAAQITLCVATVAFILFIVGSSIILR
jgi:hypothetical protein